MRYGHRLQPLVWLALAGCGSRTLSAGSQTESSDSHESETSGQDNTESGGEDNTETSGEDDTETGDEPCGLVCHNPVVVDGIQTCHSPQNGFPLRYNRVHGGGPFDPTISEPACEGDESDIECTTDVECDSGNYGKCIRGITEGHSWCRCVYSCSTDDDCNEGTLCVPPFWTNKPDWPICAPATCKGAEDCECGECGVGLISACPGTAVAVQCRTKEDLCSGYDQCDEGPCFPSQAGPWTCYFTEC